MNIQGDMGQGTSDRGARRNLDARGRSLPCLLVFSAVSEAETVSTVSADRPDQPLKRLLLTIGHDTRLKPGANERRARRGPPCHLPPVTCPF